MSALTPTIELAGAWPPLGITPVNPFELPLLNTVILLSSGATITYAHHSLISGERQGALYGTIATVLLAIIFTCFQGVEYSISSFTISDGIFGTCFYFSTGFHGLAILLKRNITIHSRNLKPNKNFINKRFYSTAKAEENLELCPNWVTGFCDAESSFSLKTSKKSTIRAKLGLRVIPDFKIELHSRDVILLRKIRNFFGVGIVSERLDRNAVTYSVQSVKDLFNIIIPHFDKYPLVTQKRADYILFKEAVNLIYSKLHLDIEGVYKIMALKASMNSGLSDYLKTQFPTVLPVGRPMVEYNNFHPNWLAGFTDGEGCFYVKILQSKTISGYQIILSFSISQHIIDEKLLTKIMDYFGGGVIEKVRTRLTTATFVIYKFDYLQNKIIPFFEKYPLQGIKKLDYLDFCKIANLMLTKEHLTPEGVKKIKSLKSGMNSGRI